MKKKNRLALLLALLCVVAVVAWVTTPRRIKTWRDALAVPEVKEVKADHSEWINIWWSEGMPRSQGALKNGKKEGLWTWWYEQRYWGKIGQKEEEGTYKNGKKEGLWTKWYYGRDQKKEEGTYENGYKTGVWTEWYENGLKKEEITYR